MKFRKLFADIWQAVREQSAPLSERELARIFQVFSTGRLETNLGDAARSKKTRKISSQRSGQSGRKLTRNRRYQANRPMKTHYYDLVIRVLMYKEDRQFVAHALEMDILGYGDTEQDARKELEGLVRNQLSFAACLGKPEIVNFSAPKSFFDRWEKAHQAQLKGDRVSEKSLGLQSKAAVFVYSQEELNKLRTSSRKRDFSKAE